ncbi:hypothetical protein NA78x_005228 [Anatilimnocola sp. NA78]|uniref:hypothetical protein n=1 Tax=Anatilimnocola sp. NA78 TaxID=3415683 RepID=UPI003CE476F0
MSQDINVLALVKGEERYIFLFDDDRRAEALRTLGRFASNPELSFSWYDAAVLSQRIRSTVPESEAPAEAKKSTARVDAPSGSVPAPHRPRFKLSLPTDTAADSNSDEV